MKDIILNLPPFTFYPTYSHGWCPHQPFSKQGLFILRSNMRWMKTPNTG